MKKEDKIINEALFWARLKYKERTKFFLEKFFSRRLDRKESLESVNVFSKRYEEALKLYEKREGIES